jgi:hypothetical protein
MLYAEICPKVRRHNALYNYITVAYVFDSHVFSDDPFIYLFCGHHLCEHLSNVPQLSNMLRLNKNKNFIVQ